MRRSTLFLGLLFAWVSVPSWAATPASFFVGQEDINFGTLPPGYSATTKTFHVSNNGGSTGSFTVKVTQSPTWISVSPPNNSTISLAPGQSTTISVTDMAGFPNNTALNATINIAPIAPATGGGNANGTYLFVSGVSINVSPQQIGFSMLPGQTKTASFSVSPAIEISATPGASWLKVSPGHSNNGGTITVTADSTGMTGGTTQVSSIDVYCAYSGPCIDKTVSVTLSVVAPAQLVINASNPTPLSVIEGSTANTTFTIDNNGGASGDFTIATSSTGNWLSTGTPQGTIAAGGELNISLIANAQNLTAGSYSGTVNVAVSGVTVRSFTVTLTVSARPKLTSDTPSATFTYQTGGATTSCGTKSASIQSNPSGNAIKYNAAVALDSPPQATWITASSSSGTTPGFLTLTCDAKGLQAGSYTGRVFLSTNDFGGSSQQINLALTVTTPATPAKLVVNASNPTPLTVVEGNTVSTTFTMDNTGGANGDFTIGVTSSGNWLSTGTPQGTIAPGSELNISLFANAQNLTAGTYPGTVNVVVAGITVSSFTVNLTVTARPKLISDTTSVAFNYQTGAATTSCGTKSASIQTNPAGNAIKYTVVIGLDNPPQAKWLTASSASGTTPGSVTLTCDATGLQAGSYTGKVFLASTDFGGSNQQISVTLTVTPPGVSTDITIASTASYKGDHLASGMIASIFGKGLAPNTVANTSTQPPTTLGGASVMVKDSAGTDRASPLFFVSDGQINFQIPLATVTGNATVRVLNGSQVVAMTTIPISATAPGLFFVGANTAAATAARYIDVQPPTPVTVFQCSDGTHCPTVPIDLTPGAVYVSLYATGLHNVTAANVVKCTVGNINVPVLYAGDQGTYPGLDQVNIQLISSLAGLGEVDVVLTVDGVASNAVRINIH